LLLEPYWLYSEAPVRCISSASGVLRKVSRLQQLGLRVRDPELAWEVTFIVPPFFCKYLNTK